MDLPFLPQRQLPLFLSPTLTSQLFFGFGRVSHPNSALSFPLNPAKMPCLRGIEVSLTTKPEDEQIPEYPHPEGTSARLLSALLLSCSNGQLSQPKAGPTVAVYIPSIPGQSFLPPPTQHPPRSVSN